MIGKRTPVLLRNRNAIEGIVSRNKSGNRAERRLAARMQAKLRRHDAKVAADAALRKRRISSDPQVVRDGD